MVAFEFDSGITATHTVTAFSELARSASPRAAAARSPTSTSRRSSRSGSTTRCPSPASASASPTSTPAPAPPAAASAAVGRRQRRRRPPPRGALRAGVARRCASRRAGSLPEGLPALRDAARAMGRPVPDLAPRIVLDPTDERRVDARRLTGQGHPDQIRADLDELRALGAAHVLLDTHRDDATARDHATAAPCSRTPPAGCRAEDGAPTGPRPSLRSPRRERSPSHARWRASASAPQSGAASPRALATTGTARGARSATVAPTWPSRSGSIPTAPPTTTSSGSTRAHTAVVASPEEPPAPAGHPRRPRRPRAAARARRGRGRGGTGRSPARAAGSRSPRPARGRRAPAPCRRRRGRAPRCRSSPT